MSSVVQGALGCLLQVAEGRLTAQERGWAEEIRAEVAADPTCPWVEIPLPAGAWVEPFRAQVRYADGRGYRLPAWRQEVGPRGPDGEGALRLALPDLLAGDRVLLTFTRHVPRSIPWTWAPEARWQRLRPGPDLATPERDDPGHWIHPRPEPMPAIGRANPPQVGRTLRLELPPDEPAQFALAPGGGSRVREETVLTFAPSPETTGWWVEAPPGRSGEAVQARPSDGASWISTPTGLHVVIPPGEGPVQLNLAWETPDAPTWGQREPGEDLLVLGGTVVWEEDRWLLAEVRGEGVTPPVDLLVRALDRRFARISSPEPGLPLSERGVGNDPDLVDRLPDLLRERTPVLPWPEGVLWPRRLVEARRTGVLTGAEAALTLRLWLAQAGLDSDWVLARPAWESASRGPFLAGYEHMLLRVWVPSPTGPEEVWLDPACSWCAAGELNPEHWGAPALSQRVKRTPDGPPGRWVVSAPEPGVVRWVLEGPAAVALRRAWWESGASSATLAWRVAGEGATLRSAEGLDEPGAAVVLEAEGPGGESPLDLPQVDHRDRAWWPWVGARRWEGPCPDPLPRPLDLAGQRLSVEPSERGCQLTLEVTDRWMSGADRSALAAALAGQAPGATEGGDQTDHQRAPLPDERQEEDRPTDPAPPEPVRADKG